MAKNLHITAGCVIKNNVVYKNEGLVFRHDQVGIDDFLSVCYQQLGINYPKFYKMDNLCKLGLLGSEVLLKGSFHKGDYASEKVAIVLSNASSSLDADIKYWESAKDVASPALFVYTLPNIVIGEICIRNGFKGEHAFYITPEFDPGLIYQQVKYLFDNNIAEAAICGWVEVVEENYSLALFLVERKNSGKPFDVPNLSITV